MNERTTIILHENYGHMVTHYLQDIDQSFKCLSSSDHLDCPRMAFAAGYYPYLYESTALTVPTPC